MERKKMLLKVPLNPGISKGSRKQKRKDFRVMLEERGDHEYCKLCNETFPNSEIEQHFNTTGHRVAQQTLTLLRFDWRHQNGQIHKRRRVPPEPIYSASSIQGILDNYKRGPLIGLEYLMEITGFGDRLLYLCVLCYERGPLELMFPRHLTSQFHKKKYLQFHFPTVYQKILSIPFLARTNENLGPCLKNIALAIERSFGRLKPIQVEAQKFRTNIMFYVEFIRYSYHCNESYGFTFEDLVNRDELIEGAKLCVNENPYFSEDDFPILEKEGKLEKFNKLSKFIDEQMHQEFTKFMKDPEKHPKYNEEWNKFWNRRIEELKAEGKDPSTYYSKPLWKKFWNERFLEIHRDEIETKKKALRTKLGLEDLMLDDEVVLIDDDSDSFKSEGESLRSSSPKFSSNSKDCPSHSSDLPDCKESSFRGENSSPQHENSSYGHKDSPFHCKDSPAYPKGSPLKDQYTIEDEPRRGTKRSWSREKSSEISLKRRSERNEDFIDEHWDQSHRSNESTLRKQDPKYPVDVEAESVNIFAVLRLLTAVEERLGSLGPKVVDLMSQALVLENKKANSSEELLNNDVNCVLLETAKEKLKGQLQVGLVDSAQQKVFVHIIRKVEILIREARCRKKPHEEDSRMMLVPGVGFVDKEKVSKQIVESLISQRKNWTS